MARSGFYSLKLRLIICVIFGCTCVTVAGSISCAEVRKDYVSQGLQDEFPENSIPDIHLRLCESDEQKGQTTCCTREMERKLIIKSRREFIAKRKQLFINYFSKLIDGGSEKLLNHLQEILSHGKNKLTKMFQATFGVLYHKRPDSFESLFNSFNEYFKQENYDLQMRMDLFFRELSKILYNLNYPAYYFHDEYLNCAYDVLGDDFKPFGGKQAEFTNYIQRSFIPIKTYLRGLAVAEKIINNNLQVYPSVKCMYELVKMNQCSICDGYHDVKPCILYCHQVHDLCLSHSLKLSDSWIHFVDSMEKLENYLSVSMNISYELSQISGKVTDVISDFRYNEFHSFDKVIKKCKLPSKNSFQEKADEHRYPIRLERSVFGPIIRLAPNEDIFNFEHGEAIRSLIQKFRRKLKKSRNFWTELPSTLCNVDNNSEETSCWDGKHLGEYINEHNELNISKAVSSFEIFQVNTQISWLKSMTRKLNAAYNGKDIPWTAAKEYSGNNLNVSVDYSANSFSTAPKCPDHFTLVGDRCLFVNIISCNWHEAKEKCGERNSHLAKFDASMGVSKILAAFLEVQELVGFNYWVGKPTEEAETEIPEKELGLPAWILNGREIHGERIEKTTGDCYYMEHDDLQFYKSPFCSDLAGAVCEILC